MGVDLESVIQSENSEEEKHHINMHVESRKIIQMDLFAGQE